MVTVELVRLTFRGNSEVCLICTCCSLQRPTFDIPHIMHVLNDHGKRSKCQELGGLRRTMHKTSAFGVEFQQDKTNKAVRDQKV